MRRATKVFLTIAPDNALQKLVVLSLNLAHNREQTITVLYLGAQVAGTFDIGDHLAEHRVAHLFREAHDG